MAEAMFKELIKNIDGENNINIISAGTWAINGQKASKHAIESLAHKNIDLNSHMSKPLTREMVEEADLILTMTTNHKMQIIHGIPDSKEKVYTLKEYAYETVDDIDISDPYGQEIEIYKACADEIEAALKKVISKYFK